VVYQFYGRKHSELATATLQASAVKEGRL